MLKTSKSVVSKHTFAIALCFLLGSFSASSAQASQQEEYLIFLSLTQRARLGRIHGDAHFAGNNLPAQGINIQLRRFSDPNWSIIATTQTGAGGIFFFEAPPSLLRNEVYQVRFQNIIGENYIWTWDSRPISKFESSDLIDVGRIEVSPIHLYWPNRGESISLPYTFQWSGLAHANLSYDLLIFDPSDNDPYVRLPLPATARESFVLTEIPPGLKIGDYYVWGLVAKSPDGGIGIPNATHSADQFFRFQ